jgi:hypothetical protein
MRASGAGWGGARAALLALGALLARPVHAADAAEGEIELQLPSELRVGQHARMLIELKLPPGAAEPLLLTPFREGAALEVVKGRLLRSDALATPGALRFELPLLALAPGSAVVGVRALAYVCGAQQCRALELETRANLLVLPR